MRISDWSSDVCSSDLGVQVHQEEDHPLSEEEVAMALEDELIGQEAANALVKWEEFAANGVGDIITAAVSPFGYSAQALLTSQISVTEFIGSTLAQVFNVGTAKIGRASCRARGCQYV